MSTAGIAGAAGAVGAASDKAVNLIGTGILNAAQRIVKVQLSSLAAVGALNFAVAKELFPQLVTEVSLIFIEELAKSVGVSPNDVGVDKARKENYAAGKARAAAANSPTTGVNLSKQATASEIAEAEKAFDDCR